MTGVVTVYATFADAAEVERIAETVVAERLAACANILGTVRSIYRWQGKVERAAETAALFKTDAARAEPLIARIAELHSYDQPVAVAWPASTDAPGIANWIAAELG